MKTFPLFIFCILLSLHTMAACGSGGLHVLPTGNTISPNSLIILEGYGNNQDIIKNLNTKYIIYLAYSKYKIKLNVTETLYGQFNLTQAVLKPEQFLKTGKEYSLLIEGLPEEVNNVIEPDRGKIALLLASFIVTGDIDTISPEIKGKIRLANKDFKIFPCGPSRHAIFKCHSKDSSSCLAKVTPYAST